MVDGRGGGARSVTGVGHSGCHHTGRAAGTPRDECHGRVAARHGCPYDGPAVSLRGLVKRFDDVAAVDGVDLDIATGEFFSMLGPSGSGKTTVLRLIGGFEKPTAGTVELDGRGRHRPGAVRAQPQPPSSRTTRSSRT